MFCRIVLHGGELVVLGEGELEQNSLLLFISVVMSRDRERIIEEVNINKNQINLPNQLQLKALYQPRL